MGRTLRCQTHRSSNMEISFAQIKNADQSSLGQSQDLHQESCRMGPAEVFAEHKYRVTLCFALAVSICLKMAVCLVDSSRLK